MQRHHPASTGFRRMQYIAFKHSSCNLPWHDCLCMQDTVESLYRPRRLISRNESRVGYPTPDYSPRTASQSAALAGGPAITDQSGASTFGSKGQPGENSPLPAIGITSSSCCRFPLLLQRSWEHTTLHLPLPFILLPSSLAARHHLRSYHSLLSTLPVLIR